MRHWTSCHPLPSPFSSLSWRKFRDTFCKTCVLHYRFQQANSGLWVTGEAPTIWFQPPKGTKRDLKFGKDLGCQAAIGFVASRSSRLKGWYAGGQHSTCPLWQNADAVSCQCLVWCKGPCTSWEEQYHWPSSTESVFWWIFKESKRFKVSGSFHQLMHNWIAASQVHISGFRASSGTSHR